VVRWVVLCALCSFGFLSLCGRLCCFAFRCWLVSAAACALSLEGNKTILLILLPR
jgi:hypothetical protein